MEQMEQGNKIKKIFSKMKSLKIVVLIAVIFTFVLMLYMILNVVSDTNYKESNEYQDIAYNELVEVTDKELVDFVNNYFVSRNKLDFINIYKAFNKDYLSMKDTEECKRYDSGILYERNYIKSFDNIKVYELNNIKYKDRVVFITFDMKFYLSNEEVPSIMLACIVNDNGKMYFKDSFNVGESKHIELLTKNVNVIKLFNDVQKQLEKKLLYDNDLKLLYNSLRQYSFNVTNDILLDRADMIEKINGKNKITEKDLIDIARKKEAVNEKE